MHTQLRLRLRRLFLRLSDSDRLILSFSHGFTEPLKRKLHRVARSSESRVVKQLGTRHQQRSDAASSSPPAPLSSVHCLLSSSSFRYTSLAFNHDIVFTHNPYDRLAFLSGTHKCAPAFIRRLDDRALVTVDLGARSTHPP